MVKPQPGVSCDLAACPLVCGAVFHICKAAEHRLLCSLERIPCLNSAIGCPSVLTRCRMAEHLAVCPAGVVCCTMEWNRGPVNYEDYHSYERLSQDANEEEQLDMALALQDQRTMLASLKLVSLTPSHCPEKKTVRTEPSRVTAVVSDAASGVSCSNDKILNGINGLNEEHFGELYQTTVETTKSLTAALGALIQLNTSGAQCATASVAQSGLNGELNELLAVKDDQMSSCNKIANGLSGLNEELQPEQHQTLMELGRSLVSALGALGDAIKGLEPSLNNKSHPLDVEMDDCSPMETDVDMDGPESSIRPQDEVPGSSMVPAVKEDGSNSSSCLEFVGPLIPHRSDVRQDRAGVVVQDPVPQLPVHAQAFVLPRDSALDFEDKAFERKLQNLQLLRNFMPPALTGRKGCLSESFSHRQPSCQMEDKSVDTSDLEQEPQEDPLGLCEIDFTAAALLFCLEESPRARRISNAVYASGCTRVDFGTQTFSFPAAILATNTTVGEVASASACDRAAPRLFQPSPFCTLRLDLTLEQLVPRESLALREGSMFTFECGQLFRREEFPAHFRNVHGDIHSGLNGWMEHRCPLAYYGCTYSQRRFCPSRRGLKVVHDSHLRSFGVQPVTDAVTEPGCDRLSELPFEILQHVARFLDGFSLCQLSMVSRTMRDVCASLLHTRGMVVVQWEKREHPGGKQSWQIRDKVNITYTFM